MQFFKKVTQRLLDARTAARLMAEDGLINTTDLLVATGATVVLAAGVGSAVIGTLDDAKYGKAQPDAQAIAQAVSQFYKDTGKWPGQAEQAPDTPGTTAPTLLVTTTETAYEPTNYESALTTTGTAACKNNSLQGFVGSSISAAAYPATTELNINDYLVRKPSETAYPNWQGPYLQAELKTDPWDKTWIINLQPLYCSEMVSVAVADDPLTEDVDESTGSNGNLGYAWILSGGANRTISTSIFSANLDSTGDDAGVNLGKLVTRGEGGLDANGD